MCAAPSSAANERERPSLLLGGGVTPSKSPVLLDPVLPRGELMGLPGAVEGRTTCSSRRPLCVVHIESTTREQRLSGLSFLERAFEEQVFGSAFGVPLADFHRPLSWVVQPSRELFVERKRAPSRGFDRARARCWGGLISLETARKCLTAAALYDRAPATASWLARGLSAQFASQLGAAPQSRSSLASSFAHPHVGVLTSTQKYSSWREEGAQQSISTERSARFFQYLESRSEQASGAAAWLSLSLAATKTRWGAPRWEGEPDLLDVLFATVKGDRNALARLFDDFAAQSVFQTELWGARLGFSWDVQSTSLPRNLVLADPLEPTGSVFVRVQLEVEDRKRTAAFRMRCESPVSYVWSVLRLDRQGDLHSRVDITYRERGGGAEARVLPQPGVATMVLVGTNMGGIDLAHPFDPDHEPHEAHGCQVYVSFLD